MFDLRSLVVACITAFLVSSTAACFQPDPEPSQNQTTDVGTERDADVEDDVDDVGHDADTDVDDDTDGGEPVEVEPWDCAPELELDEERYSHLEEMEGGSFTNHLRQLMGDHQGQGYDAARDFMFHTLEVRDDGKLECVYTGRRQAPDGTNTPGGEFNTEHTWPQSRGADTEPARSDVHHLFPSQMHINSIRGAYEFGNVACDESTCDYHDGGSFLGPSADDYRDPIFEVRPERRGDVARVVLYFSLRYAEGVSAEEEAVLRDWHCEDPPDDYERERNDAIENFQGNRNPFIDRPDFVDRIGQF